MQTTKLDIWSAGVSLLQLIAGKAPFPSSSSEQYVNLPRICPQLPADDLEGS
jgi:serine/threonine protein kinase